MRKVCEKLHMEIRSGLLLGLCCLSWSLSAQRMAVQGTVVDSSGEPVIGANVIVRGSSAGVATDLDAFLIQKYYSGKCIIKDHQNVTVNFTNKPAGYTFAGILGAWAVGVVVELYVDRISSNSDKAVVWSPNTGDISFSNVGVEVLYYKNS